VILNHTGLPADRSDEGLAGWRANLELVAACSNVCLKISGLGQPRKRWTAEGNALIIRDAIAIFGVDRCMFASNYPVDKLCAPFEAIFACFRTAVADRSLSDRRKLFAQNAMRVYRLADRPPLSIRSAGQH
jgi:predicted TIM-barrel fold metal-dependent hydrolase